MLMKLCCPLKTSSQGTFMPNPSPSFIGIPRTIGLFLHIWNGSESRKPNIVGWKIKKLLRNFEGSIGSIFKKLWGLNRSAVSYKKNECMFEPPGPKLASYGAEFFGQNIHRPLKIYGPCAYAQNIPPFSLLQIYPIFHFPKNSPFLWPVCLCTKYSPFLFPQNIPYFLFPEKYPVFHSFPRFPVYSAPNISAHLNTTHSTTYCYPLSSHPVFWLVPSPTLWLMRKRGA